MGKLNRISQPAETEEHSILPIRKLNRRRLTNQTSDNHWDRIALNTNVCFVCDKPISNKRFVYVGRKEGVMLRRHIKCHALSKKWSKKFDGCVTLTNERTKNSNG
jgi:hypothetical protein